MENGERINQGKDIYMGNHVWLVRKVSILKGSRIEDGCIVGNSSIVAGECTEVNFVFAGIPAVYKKRGDLWQK